MRTWRRFLKQMMFWTRVQQDERRLRAEVEEHLALQTAEIFEPVCPPPRRNARRC